MNVHRLTNANMYLIIPLLMFVLSAAQASSYKELLFFGILDEHSPGMHATFETMLRNRLAAESGIRITDIERTNAYREKIEFFRYPVVSTDNLSRLRKMLPDSMVFCWGKIIKTDVRFVRKTLFRSVIKGKVTASIIIYDPEHQRYLFDGEVSEEKVYKGPWTFMSSSAPAATVNAEQRIAILEELFNHVTSKSESLISAVIQNDQGIVAEKKQQIEAPPPDAPSISDVFSVPSVAPALIKNSDEIDSGTNKTLPGNTTNTGTK